MMKQQETWLKCVMLDGKQNSYGVLGYSDEISKQSVQGVAWFLLVPYGNMREKNLKKRPA